MRTAVLTTAALLFVAVTSSTGKQPPQISTLAPAVDRTPAATRSANKLLNEYVRDHEAADARYKGSFVRVSGTGSVVRVDGDYRFEFRTVTLAPLAPGLLARLPAREQQWHRAGAYPSNVTALLNGASTAEATKLKGNEEVMLIGRVKGARKADVLLDLLVELEDAELVVVERPKK